MKERVTKLMMRLARLEKKGSGFIDLSGQDFSGQDFSGWDMSRSDLSGADFSKANLEGANLSGCKADGTNFNGANLSNCKADGTNFENSNFIDANLQGSVFTECYMKMTSLNRSDLSKGEFWLCDFSLADMRGCLANVGTLMNESNFHKANLEGSVLFGDIVNCRLESCFLKGVKFRSNKIAGSLFTGSDLEQVHMWDVNIQGCDFSQCNLADVDMGGTILRRSNFEESDFSSGKILNTEMYYCLFNQSVGHSMFMKKVKILGCEFFESELVGNRLSEVSFNFCRGRNARWNNTFFDKCMIEEDNQFVGINLSKSIFIRTLVGESDFRNANFHKVILDSSRLVHADVRGALFKETEVKNGSALPVSMTQKQKEGLVY